MTTDPYLPPDFSAAALLTIDTQRDVLDGGSIEISGTSQVLPQMQALVEAFRAAHRPIVHVVRLYRPDGENVDLCRRSLVEGGASILAPATHGAQLAPVLLPDDCPALATATCAKPRRRPRACTDLSGCRRARYPQPRGPGEAPRSLPDYVRVERVPVEDPAAPKERAEASPHESILTAWDGPDPERAGGSSCRGEGVLVAIRPTR